MMVPSQTKPPKQTFVEEGSVFKGTLKSTCPVVVNGTIEGEVTAPEVTIARTGTVLGVITASTLRSYGMLAGKVDAGDVFLFGAVRSNTVIKAKTLEVKIGSSERGQLEVIFGEHGSAESSRAESDAAPVAALPSPELSTTDAVAPAEPAPAELPASNGSA
jgi:cytoskeletal protein CcmA (bactofilin family)